MSKEMQDLANMQAETRRAYLEMDPEDLVSLKENYKSGYRELVKMRALSLDTGPDTLEQTPKDSV